MINAIAEYLIEHGYNATPCPQDNSVWVEGQPWHNIEVKNTTLIITTPTINNLIQEFLIDLNDPNSFNLLLGSICDQ